MKTTLLGMAAVAMMFASCAKNEVNSPKDTVIPDAGKISFMPSTGNVSRAVDVTNTTLENDPNGFAIVGLDNSGASLFETGETYKYAGGEWNWSSTKGADKGYTWPGGIDKYPVRFYGCFPHNLGIAADNLKYTPTIAGKMADQKDYLFVTAEVADKPSNGLVALKFKHILSKIAFNVETKKGMTVYVQSIKVINVADAGGNDYYYDLTLADGGVQKGGWTSAGAPTGGEVTYAHFTGAVGSVREVTTDPAGDDTQAIAVAGDEQDGALMLLPQGGVGYKVWDKEAFTKGYAAAKDNAEQLKALMAGARIEVVYRIVDADGKDYIGHGGDGTDPTNAAKYVTVAYPLDLASAANAWVMNTKYTYTIKLGTPDASNGTVTEPEFKDEDGGDTGEELDNPAVTPGEPVSSGKIGFTVTVDPWGDKTGTIN